MMSYERNENAGRADETFWATFHSGKYQNIDDAQNAQKSAYLANPRDWMTASHIGFIHAWRFAERSRLITNSPSFIDDAELARFYFDEAYALYPKDPRLKGFLAAMTMVSGKLHQDEQKIRKGIYLGLEAIREWPEFNLFTLGYFMSTKDAASKEFNDALDWQWQWLDACAGETVNRNYPDYSSYMNNEVADRKIRKKSVCWNSWIAPHNFEGFFLNMGDMLLKAGEKKKAITIYNNARLSSAFDRWPYKHILEQRLLFARAACEGVIGEYAPKPMMLDASYSCVACHQER